MQSATFHDGISRALRAIKQRAQKRTSTPAKCPTVLVVDDERTIADTLTAILRKSGFQAHTAYSAGTALHISLLVKPDLVITDVMMPDKDGIEMSAEILANVPHCRILLFSGDVAHAHLLLAVSKMNQHWEVLAKPVHPHDLLAKIRGLVDVPGECEDLLS